MELSENDKSVTVEEFAEVRSSLIPSDFLSCISIFRCNSNLLFSQIVYGSKESLESYCAHFLLSRDIVYFVKVESRDSSVYQPRPPAQVYFLNIPMIFISRYTL